MVLIKPIGRLNPQDMEAPEKFYAHAVADGYADLEELARTVSKQCTVREADCLGVLRALVLSVMDELEEGKIVKLGALGNFQVGVRSTSRDTSYQVNASAVKQAHINYRPGKRVRKLLKTLEYKVIEG